MMFIFSHRFLSIVPKTDNESSEEQRYLIIDNTSCFKRGKNIEGHRSGNAICQHQAGRMPEKRPQDKAGCFKK